MFDPRSLERAMNVGRVVMQAQMIATFTSTTLLNCQKIGQVLPIIKLRLANRLTIAQLLLQIPKCNHHLYWPG
jgi:hypothetical protein